MKRYVTYSELRTRRRCPWKGHLEYDRLLSPVVKAPGLREGSIMDAGLNALYENHRLTGEHDLEVMLAAIGCAAEKEEARIAAGAQLFQEEWQAIRERTELLKDVARFYVPWARVKDQQVRVVTRQLQGDVPVLAPSGRPSSKYQFRFKPDGIVAMSGQLWLWEDKAWKIVDRESLRLLTIDEQCGMYLWGLRQLISRGEAPAALKDAVATYGQPTGVIYNVLRKKTPTIPKQLKDGSTSRDKAIDTTEEVYRQTLAERSQDPAAYAEILEVLREKGNPFFVRQAVLRNEAELDEIGERIWAASQLISQRHIFKAVDRTCAQCQFYPLCLEWSDELLTSGYRTRERIHEEYEELEEAA